VAKVYKITNLINNKIYVGKTNYTILEKRIKEHFRYAKRFAHRPLYKDINKYGVKIFSYELIEETNNGFEREKYWIKKLNTFEGNGYNLTLGGVGRRQLDYNKICEDYLKMGNLTKVAKINQCSIDSVKKIIDNKNILTISSSTIIQKKYSKKTNMMNLNNELLKTFPSQIEGARYLIKNHYSNVKNATSLSHKISLVKKGQRKSCCGFKWE